jgi:hypothetical protein
MHKLEHAHKSAIKPTGVHVKENEINCAEEKGEKDLECKGRKLIE